MSGEHGFPRPVGRPKKINPHSELWTCKLDARESALSEALAEWLVRRSKIKGPTRFEFARYCIHAYAKQMRNDMMAGKVPPLFG